MLLVHRKYTIETRGTKVSKMGSSGFFLITLKPLGHFETNFVEMLISWFLKTFMLLVHRKYTIDTRGLKVSKSVLISEELSCHIINIKIIHCSFSDHDIKIMKLNVCDITGGSGTWIMNLHTIRSDYFRQVFTNWWVYWKLEKKSFSNLREWWDIAKIKIKSITIEASKKVNTTDDKIKALENKLETLKDISEPSRQQLEELADLENQIHSHYENKTDAARLRAKVDWYEKGEQSTKKNFNLERKNAQNKLWQKIRGLDGNLKYDIDEILDEQINFYANLFST